MSISLQKQAAQQRLIHDNEIPSLPEDWAVERFRFQFRESKERNEDQAIGEMLSVSEYRGVVPKIYENAEQQRTAKELKSYRVVRPGQLAVNTMWLNHLGLGVSEHLGHVSPAYAVYNISKKLNVRFAHHLLRSQYYLKIYLRYLYGIRPNSFQIKSDDWNSIPVIVPPRKTQKTIANFLDRETARIDQLIEKKQRLVEVLAQARKAKAVQSLSVGILSITWSLKSQRLLFDYSKLGWETVRLKHLVTFMTSGSRGWGDRLSDEGEVFLQSGNIGRQMEVNFDEVQRVKPQFSAEAGRASVQENDTLVCITGGRTGAVGYLNQVPEKSYINQHVCLLRPNQKKIEPLLLAQILWSEIGSIQFELCQYGLKQGLGFSEVANIKIPLPPRKEQKKIATIIAKEIDKIDTAIEFSGTSMDRLKEFRSALITAAVTGQIDVTTWDKRGETEQRLDMLEQEADV